MTLADMDKMTVKTWVEKPSWETIGREKPSPVRVTIAKTQSGSPSGSAPAVTAELSELSPAKTPQGTKQQFTMKKEFRDNAPGEPFPQWTQRTMYGRGTQ